MNGIETVISEEDTFRVLSRPSIQEMAKLYAHWIGDLEDMREWNDVCEDNGWTEQEFADNFLPPR